MTTNTVTTTMTEISLAELIPCPANDRQILHPSLLLITDFIKTVVPDMDTAPSRPTPPLPLLP